MLSKEAIEAIQLSIVTEEFEVDGVRYFSRPLHDVRRAEPQAAVLSINTLTGIVDYLKANVDGLDKSSLMLHVASHSRVDLVGKLAGHFRQREDLVSASNDDLFAGSFRFGTYHDAESFNIALQTLFVRTDEVSDVLRIIGNIKEEDVKTLSDDGVTQSVVARSGIVKVTDVDVPNPIKLQPYRTFRDIEQPASLFVLRMKKNAGAMPSCALFEADGGKWKLDAIQSVKAFLGDNTDDVVIVG